MISTWAALRARPHRTARTIDVWRGLANCGTCRICLWHSPGGKWASGRARHLDRNEIETASAPALYRASPVRIKTAAFLCGSAAIRACQLDVFGCACSIADVGHE